MDKLNELADAFGVAVVLLLLLFASLPLLLVAH